MKNQKRIRDFGYTIGHLPTGPRNAITDVAGVRVGHATLNCGTLKTGVTAVLPHAGNLFTDKPFAASHVINGFGKSTGTIQINELGTLETPIILTNTLSVGDAFSGLVTYMLDRNPDIGRTTGTVNPVILECNDGYLNDIRAKAIEKKHILEAISDAGEDFFEGAVGAGTGMSCFGLKGGIGTSSRIISYAGTTYTIGTLVLTNMGNKEDLIVCGDPVGKRIAAEERKREDNGPDGSIIILLATDMPVSTRQLKRLSKRAVVGLSRTGSHMDHGSGEIVIAFTTANRIAHTESEGIQTFRMINDNNLNLMFRAVSETCEEAVLNAMVTAPTTTGIMGHVRKSLRDYLA